MQHPKANIIRFSLTFQSSFTFSAVLAWNYFVDVFHILVHIITGFVVTVLLGQTGRQEYQNASRKWLKQSVYVSESTDDAVLFQVLQYLP